tara:strand:+ start:320 stop:667 length:348 start_codon:yes stop_codon:yes gene_type:complete
MSRIAPLVDNLIGSEDADDLMIEIMDILSDSEQSVPEVGKIYVFVYQPKTSGRYDQNPLVAVTNIFDWGFRGINFHWGQPRQYTFQEVVGQLYQVTNEELQDLNTIPFAKFRINN